VTPEAFIDLLMEDALRLERETGLPAAVTIAQAALETGWGRNAFLHDADAERALMELESSSGEYCGLPDGSPSYNLFGIKRHYTDAPFVVCWDHEYVDGRPVRVPARFRRYRSYAESMEDRYAFLRENPRYAKVLALKDPYEFATGLQEAGYATDPQYAEKSHSIMRRRVIPRLTGRRADGPQIRQTSTSRPGTGTDLARPARCLFGSRVLPRACKVRIRARSARDLRAAD